MATITSLVNEFNAWYKDNGSPGAKTKLSILWDFYIHRKEQVQEEREEIKTIKAELDIKLDKTECSLKHDTLVAEIKRMLDDRDKTWKWWVEQLKWAVPIIWLAAIYLNKAGIL